MCKWRRYLYIGCGHPEFVLLCYCEEAEHLPQAYLREVLGLDRDSSVGVANTEDGLTRFFNHHQGQFGTDILIAGMVESQYHFVRQQEPDDVARTTTTMQLQYQDVECPADEGNDESQDAHAPSLSEIRKTLADAAPYDSSLRRGATSRRNSNPPRPELSILIDDIQAMKEELTRLQEQATHQGALSREWHARRWWSRQANREDDANVHGETNDYQCHDHTPGAGVQQSAQPRSVQHSSEFVTLSTRRSRSADTTAYGVDLIFPAPQQQASPQTPRFARPTAATTRRADETLHKQIVTLTPSTDEKLSYFVKPPRKESKRSLGTKASRLPKRTGLPGVWLSPVSSDANKASQDAQQQDAKYCDAGATNTKDKQTSSGSPVVKKEKSPQYMSPTKATLRRETETLQTLTKERPARPSRKPARKSIDTTALALAEVNATTMRLAKALQSPEPTVAHQEVENTYPMRRTSHSDILAPIFRKLNRQGLLRQESVADDPMSSHGMTNKKRRQDPPQRKRSYAEVLRPDVARPPTIYEMPALRGQTSAAIGRALAELGSGMKVPAKTNSRSSSKQPSAVGQDRVVIPSSSTYVSVDAPSQSFFPGKDIGKVAEQTSTELMHAIDKHVSSCEVASVPDVVTSRAADKPTTIAAVQQRPDLRRSMSSTLNATAAAFVPEPCTAAHKAVIERMAFNPRAAMGDDVFMPNEEWYSLSREEQANIKRRRQEKYREYHTPLAWRKEQIVAQWARQQQLLQSASSNNALSPERMSLMHSPGSSAYSPDSQRHGWQVAGSDGGPCWSGGKGREIRFHGHAADAEQRREARYTYKNRDTGRAVLVDRQDSVIMQRDWARELDAVNRLEASVQMGHSCVPCANQDAGGDDLIYLIDTPCQPCWDVWRQNYGS